MPQTCNLILDINRFDQVWEISDLKQNTVRKQVLFAQTKPQYSFLLDSQQTLSETRLLINKIFLLQNMVDRSDKAALFLLYAPFALATISSILNIIIIITEKLASNDFASIILLMQLCSFMMAFIDFIFFPSINITLCRIQGALFYGFMTSNFMFLSYFLFKIYKTLKKQKQFITKYNIWIIIGIFVLPIGWSFISFNTYDTCGYSDFQFYCGICASNPVPVWNRIILAMNYVIPAFCGIVMYIILAVYIRKLDKSNILKQELLALRIIYIPLFNLIYLVINSVLTIFVNTNGSDHFYLYFVLDSTWTIIPTINLIFYRNFAYHWAMTHNTQLKCCKWMIIKSRLIQQQDTVITSQYSFKSR